MPYPLILRQSRRRVGAEPRAGILCYSDCMVEGAQIESAIRSELKHFSNVAFAFLFGSAAANRLRTDSDIDVAVYVDADGRLEIEEERETQLLSFRSLP